MSCDYSEFKKLLENLEKEDKRLEDFIESCAKEIAARLLAKVIKRTPVGQYPSSSGKVGGTLRRGWTCDKDSNAVDYVKSLKITKSGNVYTIEIINPVEYASYVEFGHRTSNGEGWVEGRFMLTISEEEIERAAPSIIEKKIKKELGGIFN